MTNITEQSVWEPNVYQLAESDPVLGGQPGFDAGVPVAGHANAAIQQLANRTKWLKDNTLNTDSVDTAIDYCVQRVNHTGEQDISTVTGLQTALDKATYAPVVTETTTARVSVIGDTGSYVRFTNTGAKTYTIEPQANVAWVVNTEIHGRNAAASNLTLTPGEGVTLNTPFGGTLLIPTGGSFTLKLVAEDEWDVIGQTEAAP